MDKIIWQLGAETSQVRAEMARAVQSGQQGGQQLARSFDSVDAGHEKILKGGAKVSKQISGVAKDMLHGASATDLFASSLSGLGKSLNLSLGTLTSIFVGAAILQKINEVRQEYAKLEENLKAAHKAASQSGNFKALSEIESQAKLASSAVEELNKRMDARSGKKGFWASAGQGFKDVAYDVFTGSAVENEDTKSREKGQASANELTQQGLAKRRQQTGLKEAELSGTPDYQIKAAQQHIRAQEAAAKGLDEAAQAFREMNVELKALLQKQNDKKMERAGRSLTEIAESAPDVVNNSGGGPGFVSYEQWANSQQAKKALRLKGQAEAAKAAGNTGMAHDLFNQSDEAAQGVTGLKPSEKMSADFKGALAVTEEQLKVIAENTAGKLVNK